ncbi:kinase-like domain [Cordyceps militaris]|uniref:Kinase-like domain n=1 Tax=Cordyceps militaris TaxID=73501 RepID=A0A2H4SQT3_CORMI|nr:kinase-like domain [Cordyceps militaris]
MAPPTNQELNDKREENCISITPDRKYYRVGGTMVKRSLRPSEWQQHNGYMHIPLFNLERILNEGACLQFLSENTDIPLPKLYACFEDDGAAYLVTEYVDGVVMEELDEGGKKIVEKELNQHMETLQRLKSSTWGGPGGKVLPPWRILKNSDRRPWKLKQREEGDLVFCHNDLSAYNVIVDPETLKIRAIIDWEYAGYYTPEFEQKYFKRKGPSVALDGEIDDTEKLTKILARYKI